MEVISGVVEANALLDNIGRWVDYLCYFKQATTYFTRETVFTFLLSYQVFFLFFLCQNVFRKRVSENRTGIIHFTAMETRTIQFETSSVKITLRIELKILTGNWLWFVAILEPERRIWYNLLCVPSEMILMFPAANTCEVSCFFQSMVVLYPKRTKWLCDRHASKLVEVSLSLPLTRYYYCFEPFPLDRCEQASCLVAAKSRINLW